MRFPASCLLLFASLGLLVGGCASHSHSIYQFSTNPMVEKVVAATRSVKLYSQFDTILILDVIRYDDTLRAALLQSRVADEKLSEADVEEQAQREQQEIGVDRRRFIFALYTDKGEWNDLHKENSRWSIHLQNGAAQGGAAMVGKIAEDKIPLRDYLPFEGVFRTFYYVDFPKEIEGDGVDIITLSGALGSVELRWQ